MDRGRLFVAVRRKVFKMKFNPHDIDKSLNDLYGKVMDAEEKHNGSKYSGMTYEDGIKATIDWIQDEGNPEKNDPMD